MRSESIYAPLKLIGILMGLDAGGAIADTIQSFSGALRTAGSTAGGGISLSHSLTGIYCTWIILIVRLLVWAMTLITLSRLTDVRPSFQKARLWYLLRILAYMAELLPSAIVYSRYPNLLSVPNLAMLLLSALVVSLGSILIGECLLLPMGNRVILLVDAELSESFGLESQARKDRLCGRRLLRVSLAFLCLLFLSIAPEVWVRMVKGVSLYSAAGDAFPGLLLLELAAVLLCIGAGAAILIYRLLAAVRMIRTYRAIEELTR